MLHFQGRGNAASVMMDSVNIVATLGPFVLTLAFVIVTIAGECLNEQAFSNYSDNHEYAVNDANSDFASTRGPYKMIKDGGGSPLTRMEGGAIRGSFPKGKARYMIYERRR
jgi:hypothetical protein